MFEWRNFAEFLDTYAEVGSVVREADDLRMLTEQWLVRSAESGTIYSELMLSPNHVEQLGIKLEDQVAAISDGIAAARDRCGIESIIIATCIRHYGPEEAMRLVRSLTRLHSPVICGFGLTGDEHKFEARDFASAFSVAQDIGLGLTAHTGEWRDAQSILQTVKSLNLQRIGHGLRAAEDGAVLTELNSRSIGWEICLSSNLQLKYRGMPELHPFRELLRAGCRVALGTDDPGFFQTSPKQEYQIAQDLYGLTEAELVQINQHAIDMAFCSAPTKAKLRSMLG